MRIGETTSDTAGPRRLMGRRPDGVDDATVEAVGALMDGARHVFEAEMKQRRRTSGRPGHEEGPVGDGKEPR